MAGAGFMSGTTMATATNSSRPIRWDEGSHACPADDRRHSLAILLAAPQVRIEHHRPPASSVCRNGQTAAPGLSGRYASVDKVLPVALKYPYRAKGYSHAQERCEHCGARMIDKKAYNRRASLTMYVSVGMFALFRVAL